MPCNIKIHHIKTVEIIYENGQSTCRQTIKIQ